MGAGKAIMLEALKIIDKDYRGKQVFLESQLDKIGFYEKLGFEAVGEIFLDARMPHKKMIKFCPTKQEENLWAKQSLSQIARVAAVKQ